MPMFATGNTGWDQGLNTLAGSLFPDPSKQAQAGYYGAETANALIKGYQTRDQMGQQRYLQDLMARGGVGPTAIPGPAAPPGPEAPPGLVIPQGGPPGGGGGGAAPPAPGPQPLAITPTGLPPAGPAPPGTPSPGPPAAVLPSLLASTVAGGGTGQPPVPPTAQPAAPPQQGGGVRQSPPAQANGSPTPPMVNLPYLMATAARAGMDPNVVKLLGTSWINGQIQSGAMDKATGERFLSGAGDSAPLQATTSITTTGMNNATSIRTTEMNNATTLAQPGAQAAATQSLEDAKTVTVVLPDGRRVGMKMGDYRKDPSVGRVENVNDQGTTTTVGPDNQPVITPNTQAPGKTPYESTQAAHDKNNISIVTPQGEVITTTEGGLRANPALGRKYDPQVDGALVQVLDPATGKTVFRLAARAPGAQVAPKSTDELGAQGGARITQQTETNPAAAPGVTEAVQAGTVGTTGKTPLTPDQELRISGMVDQTVQQMYPVPSGMHLSRSTAPRALDAATKAEVMSRVRDLAVRDPKYRADPAGAVPIVLEQMRSQGILPKDVDSSIGYLSQSSPDLTGGKDPRYLVHGNLSGAKPPAGTPTLSGTVTSSMPGGAQAAPNQPAPPVPPQAPPQAPAQDTGPPVVTGRAVTSARGAPEGRGVIGTLADAVTAPGRFVSGRMAHKPGVMTGQPATPAPLNRAINRPDVAGVAGGPPTPQPAQAPQAQAGQPAVRAVGAPVGAARPGMAEGSSFSDPTTGRLWVVQNGQMYLGAVQ
jgi:hypothetical protein